MKEETTLNRVIKFRAWTFHAILEKHVMQSHEEISGNCLKFVTDNEAFKNRVIMQFTGLTDKNGKEIYEGDVIEYDGELMGNIVFNEGCFWTNGIDTIHAYEFDKSCYIIGNIYEHPHLLTPLAL